MTIQVLTGVLAGLFSAANSAETNGQDPHQAKVCIKIPCPSKWEQANGGTMRVAFRKGGRVEIKDGLHSLDARYKLDPTSNPSQIDLCGGSYPGIYRLEGNRLTICLTMKTGGPRPNDFTCKPGSGKLLWTLVRKKP
jgi:uncharacterized protein (TIGR03067 family)